MRNSVRVHTIWEHVSLCICLTFYLSHKSIEIALLQQALLSLRFTVMEGRPLS